MSVASRRRGVVALALLAWSIQAAYAGGALSTTDLGNLSLEDLGKVVVSSVTKTAESLGNAPAAVYVISHDDIMRSGARGLPDILRLAPNLEVFQTSPANYTITARGFSGNPGTENLSDKLLVLVDGRSVYNPLFSGMYWEMQEVLPENIERIEVISGPGATMWGANAMNGVINIVTRQSSQTRGGLLDIGVGNQSSSVAAQYGGRLGAHSSYRVYATKLRENAFDAADGSSAHDGWRKSQAGFRADWAAGPDAVTVEGDAFDGRMDQGSAPDQLISGGNLLTNWQRQFDEDSSLQVLAYYDRVHRMAAPHDGGFTIDTYALELQHDVVLGAHNHVVWGAGARNNRFDIVNAVSPAASLIFTPAHFDSQVVDVFAQDQITLGSHLGVVVGMKFERDPYTGWTPLPNLRASWRFADDAMAWAAVSRAIRSPTPLDTSVDEKVGAGDFLVGNPDFLSEKLTAYELGYRQQVGRRASFSVSLFDHRYDDLKTVEVTPVTVLPLVFGNGMEGDVYGAELWGSYQPTDGWRLSAGLTLQNPNLRFKPDASKLLGTWQAGDDPRHQGFLRSTVSISERWAFTADLRRVGPLPNPRVPGYTELNARLAWQASDSLELALSGFNLLHPWHQEYVFPGSDRIGRSVSLDARVRF